MNRRLLANIVLVALTVLLTSIFQPLSRLQTLAQPGPAGPCQTFPETGIAACGRFLDYWRTHGGLAQQGFPISGEFVERSALDGKTYTVQYFERAVFELHPENQPPYDVLLSQLGTFRYRQLYTEQGPPPAPISTAQATVQPVGTATPTPPTPVAVP